MSEGLLVRGVLEALQAAGCFAWRTNSGVFRGAGGVVRGAPAGTPDIIGILPGGRFFGLECKTAQRRERLVQRRWALAARKLGAKVATVRSINEAMFCIEEWTKPQKEP